MDDCYLNTDGELRKYGVMVFENYHKLGAPNPNFVKSGDQIGILT
jgi:hypothetical protein